MHLKTSYSSGHRINERNSSLIVFLLIHEALFKEALELLELLKLVCHGGLAMVLYKGILIYGMKFKTKWQLSDSRGQEKNR